MVAKKNMETRETDMTTMLQPTVDAYDNDASQRILLGKRSGRVISAEKKKSSDDGTSNS